MYAVVRRFLNSLGKTNMLEQVKENIQESGVLHGFPTLFKLMKQNEIQPRTPGPSMRFSSFRLAKSSLQF